MEGALSRVGEGVVTRGSLMRNDTKMPRQQMTSGPSFLNTPTYPHAEPLHMAGTFPWSAKVSGAADHVN